MERIIPHEIILADDDIVLRPMSESDWDDLLRWNNDPEVLYYAEGDRSITSRTLAETQRLYRMMARKATCFIIEYDRRPIGECWLQPMNLERLLVQYPEQDCRRIDLMIGEKTLWNRGIGTRVIRLLTAFGFDREQADLIFGCEIADDNPRSQNAFRKNGYVGSDAGEEGRTDMMIAKEQWKPGRFF